MDSLKSMDASASEDFCLDTPRDLLKCYVVAFKTLAFLYDKAAEEGPEKTKLTRPFLRTAINDMHCVALILAPRILWQAATYQGLHYWVKTVIELTDLKELSLVGQPPPDELEEMYDRVYAHIKD